MNKSVCISVESLDLKALFPRDGYFIQVGEDENDKPYYYDLWANGILVCMDGEVCTVLDRANGMVHLLSESGTEGDEFYLTEREFEIATEVYREE